MPATTSTASGVRYIVPNFVPNIEPNICILKYTCVLFDIKQNITTILCIWYYITNGYDFTIFDPAPNRQFSTQKKITLVLKISKSIRFNIEIWLQYEVLYSKRCTLCHHNIDKLSQSLIVPPTLAPIRLCDNSTTWPLPTWLADGSDSESESSHCHDISDLVLKRSRCHQKSVFFAADFAYLEQFVSHISMPQVM